MQRERKNSQMKNLGNNNSLKISNTYSVLLKYDSKDSKGNILVFPPIDESSERSRRPSTFVQKSENSKNTNNSNSSFMQSKVTEPKTLTSTAYRNMKEKYG